MAMSRHLRDALPTGAVVVAKILIFLKVSQCMQQVRKLQETYAIRWQEPEAM